MREKERERKRRSERDKVTRDGDRKTDREGVSVGRVYIENCERWLEQGLIPSPWLERERKGGRGRGEGKESQRERERERARERDMNTKMMRKKDRNKQREKSTIYHRQREYTNR